MTTKSCGSCRFDRNISLGQQRLDHCFLRNSDYPDGSRCRDYERKPMMVLPMAMECGPIVPILDGGAE